MDSDDQISIGNSTQNFNGIAKAERESANYGNGVATTSTGVNGSRIMTNLTNDSLPSAHDTTVHDKMKNDENLTNLIKNLFETKNKDVIKRLNEYHMKQSKLNFYICRRVSFIIVCFLSSFTKKSKSLSRKAHQTQRILQRRIKAGQTKTMGERDGEKDSYISFHIIYLFIYCFTF